MPKKEIIHVNLAAANPNLSPATRFGNLVFVAGQTGRHPIIGEVGRDVREQTRYAIERIKMILETAPLYAYRFDSQITRSGGFYIDGRRQKRIGRSTTPRRRRHGTHRHYGAGTAQAMPLPEHRCLRFAVLFR